MALVYRKDRWRTEALYKDVELRFLGEECASPAASVLVATIQYPQIEQPVAPLIFFYAGLDVSRFHDNSYEAPLPLRVRRQGKGRIRPFRPTAVHSIFP